MIKRFLLWLLTWADCEVRYFEVDPTLLKAAKVEVGDMNKLARADTYKHVLAYKHLVRAHPYASKRSISKMIEIALDEIR